MAKPPPARSATAIEKSGKDGPRRPHLDRVSAARGRRLLGPPRMRRKARHRPTTWWCRTKRPAFGRRGRKYFFISCTGADSLRDRAARKCRRLVRSTGPARTPIRWLRDDGAPEGRSGSSGAGRSRRTPLTEKKPRSSPSCASAGPGARRFAVPLPVPLLSQGEGTRPRCGQLRDGPYQAAYSRGHS